MATNTTTKKPAAPTAVEQPSDADVVTQPAPAPRPPALAGPVGPAVNPFEAPVTITLSHHLEVDGTHYTPGDEILVSPEYAERLRVQGYTPRS
ncbi:hypothetical protein HHL19_35365 [Streptomyces sp. R302]|uniref:hypothetical protein n=1 Tax=unclassified Streptomyces TaxID=2593676 RepID=UPI00145D14DF|nr:MULTISPECIES: hypothetical protein [unclassified Streptomyces]NML55179.1 hypothetical protein [Streptomyces sp. R301]NML83791.1 hypothetical protein [Streptomyces sp. R302]